MMDWLKMLKQSNAETGELNVNFTTVTMWFIGVLLLILTFLQVQ